MIQMRWRVAVIAAAPFFFASCGGSPSNAGSAQSLSHGSQVTGDSAWQLTYQSTCVSGAAEACRGLYGLKIGNDGSYFVGPGPDHQILTGRLEPGEIQRLRQFLDGFHVADFEIASRGAEKCVQAAAGAVTSIRIAHLDSSHGIVRVAGSEVCFDGTFVSTMEDAKSLQKWLSELADRYYPDSFPSPCITAASLFTNNFSDLQQCQRDSDCAYLDENFLPALTPHIPVFVDDCSVITPVPVANAFAAVANQRELLIQRDVVRTACGANLKKPSCTNPWSFDSGSAPPICVQGSCELSPAVHIHS